MQQIDLTLGIVMVVSSLGTALLALLLMSYLQPARRISWTPIDALGEPVVFLFRDRTLVDATPDAHALLETGPEFLAEWPRFLAVFEPRFPGLSGTLGELAERQFFSMRNEAGASIDAEWRGGLARIVVTETAKDIGGADRFSHQALVQELATLRGVVDHAPMLVWKEDASGDVRWANGAYVTFAERLRAEGEEIGWPLPRIFAQQAEPDDRSASRRLSVDLPDGETRWFDALTESRGSETIIFALPADTLVRAEVTLREFVQTLTKTFAHLPTGLAVFDQDRRLAMFNPAMSELSALEPQFLAGRPTLFEFLDKLRQKQRAPEPRDFKSWRRQMIDLESAAASGTYHETWSLPSGQTYRVTGRPHPDGAIVFIFEDISEQIAQTRRFRSEAKIARAIFDSLDEAIAIFSGSGSLTQHNEAYRRLWNHDTGQPPAETGIKEAIAVWQAACRPDPLWSELQELMGKQTDRREWRAEMRLLDGRALACRVMPLTGYTTLIAFSAASEKPDQTETRTKLTTSISD